MIVVIAGLYRSGSTFTFNVAKELLARTGTVAQISDNSYENALRASEGADHLVVKSHVPDARLTELIRESRYPCVCSYRKPEDAIASWIRTFGGETGPTIEMFHAWLQWHSTMHDYVENVSYEKIETEPCGVVLQLQRYICGAEDASFAHEINERLAKDKLKVRFDRLAKGEGTTDLGFSYFDNETFFHRHHISSIEPIPAVDELPAGLIAEIRSRFALYVDSDGEYRYKTP